MPTTTYTQTEGDDLGIGHTYFMDVELSPVTLADGSLRHRLDTTEYPQLGVITIPDTTITSITPNSGAHNTTGLAVTIVGTQFDNGSTVTFSGTGITVVSTGVSDDGHTIVLSLNITNAAAQTARDVTVTDTDGGTVVSTGGFTVT